MITKYHHQFNTALSIPYIEEGLKLPTKKDRSTIEQLKKICKLFAPLDPELSVIFCVVFYAYGVHKGKLSVLAQKTCGKYVELKDIDEHLADLKKGVSICDRVDKKKELEFEPMMVCIGRINDQDVEEHCFWPDRKDILAFYHKIASFNQPGYTTDLKRSMKDKHGIFIDKLLQEEQYLNAKPQ
jgi:hypothetical protein